MDLASCTIDRHEPLIPDYIQGELSLKQEHVLTKIKNRFVLRHCNVGQIKRWVKVRPTPSAVPPKVVTRELLARALAALDRCRGLLGPVEIEYLDARRFDQADVERFRICSTQVLCRHLDAADVANLSLRISDKFSGRVATHEIVGVSVPCFNGGDFYGFCTRVLNQPLIKYSITIPHRFCFGLDWSRPEEIYLVEGVFDAMRLIKAGYNCMALGDSQPNYWKLYTANKFKHVNLLFDSDYSGLIGACKAHIILEEMLGRSPQDMTILVPSGKDPAVASTWSKTDLKTLAARLTSMGRSHEF